jgi:hypothetical protein
VVVRCQLNKCRTSSGIALPLVLHQRLEPDAPMSANAAVFDLTRVE